jgi:protein-S-isoprenylcysteine O-methyltransferase Ste14
MTMGHMRAASPIEDFLQVLLDRWRSMGWLEVVTTAIIALCVLAIFISIVINFVECSRTPAKTVKRSIVATGTMSLFFMLFYLLLRFRVGALDMGSFPVRIALAVAGLALMVAGCCVNIAGRLSLGRNWANQVTIYADQRLVTGGVYRLVRHPLYASLIWMFFGASLVYENMAALLANALVFLPFMTYRARQEEKLLMREFKEYAEYRARVGMFL